MNTGETAGICCLTKKYSEEQSLRRLVRRVVTHIHMLLMHIVLLSASMQLHSAVAGADETVEGDVDEGLRTCMACWFSPSGT